MADPLGTVPRPDRYGNMSWQSALDDLCRQLNDVGARQFLYGGVRAQAGGSSQSFEISC